MRNIRIRKAVSPVIATVILVAVAITIAVSVSFWMGGISGQYTKFEQVEIQSGVCTVDANGNWTVTMQLKNSGTATSTIILISINDVEVDLYDSVQTAGNWTTSMTDTFSLTSGQSATIYVYISSYHPPQSLSAGTVVNIKLHSARGMDYTKMLLLV